MWRAAAGRANRLGGRQDLGRAGLRPQADRRFPGEDDLGGHLGLHAFGPAPDKPKVAARVFRFFHDSLASGKGDDRNIAKALYHMAMDGYVPAPEVDGPMWVSWDELDLAVDGIYGDAAEIQEKKLRFLAEVVR